MVGDRSCAVLALLLAGVTAGAAAPPFVEEPTNGSVVLGSEAELRCAVRGGGAVQWARGGLLLGTPPTPAHPRYRLAGDPQQGQHHLRIAGVRLEDDDVFECQVAGGDGAPPQASRPALLTVLVPPGPPTLELPPGAELPWVGGAEVQVRCHAPDARPAARLTLTLGGEPLPDVSTRVVEGSHPKLSSSEATVRLTPPSHAHGQRLVCSAANEAGPAPAEAELTLDVLFPPSAPTIEGLESPHVRAGDTLRLVCVVRGGNPPPSLHWDKDGVPLAGSWVTEGHPGVSRSRVTVTVTPGDDGSTLRCSTHSPLPPGGGSASVTLSVTYPPAEVTIAGTPTVAENGTVALSCTSSPSNPPVQLRWWLGGRELTPTDVTRTQAEGRGWVTVSNVTLGGRRQEHGRPLVCEAAAPGLGARSATLVLSVTHPPQQLWLEAPPPNSTFRVGQRLRLACHARGGHPPPRLVWTKDGRPLKEGTQVWGGAVVTRELEVTLTPSDNGAAYGCRPGGDPPAPPLSARTRLRVLFPPASVTITASPREPRPGHTLTLTCLAATAHPAPDLRWHHQGRMLAGERLPPSAGAFGGVSAASRLRLPLGLGDQGQRVTCHALSPALGVAVSADHRLVLRHAPQFSAGAGALVVAREHGGARLPLTVLAHPPVESCAWSLAGRPLLPEGSPRHRPLEGGGLDIANVTRGDAGTYRVECRNAEGAASTHLRLHVHYPPAIVRVPDPVVVDEGGSAELLCEAEGSPLPPGLTWGRLASGGRGRGASPGAAPRGGLPVGRLRVLGARRDLGGPYECRVDTGVAPPARAIVRLVVRYGPELEAESEAEPVPVLVPDGADTAQLRCRAGVPGVQLRWEHRGHPLRPEETRFQEHQWHEGPWTSSLLTVANISQDRARLRHQYHRRDWDQYKNRHRHQYLNWHQDQNWDWDQNQTLGAFVCVAQNPLGTVRRRLQLRLADRPEPPQNLRVSGVTPTSLHLAWTPGFDGGLPQSFLVSARGPGAPPPAATLLVPGSTLTLGGLRPATPYDVTVRARNDRGDSAAAVIRAVTSGNGGSRGRKWGWAPETGEKPETGRPNRKWAGNASPGRKRRVGREADPEVPPEVLHSGSGWRMLAGTGNSVRRTRKLGGWTGSGSGLAMKEGPRVSGNTSGWGPEVGGREPEVKVGGGLGTGSERKYLWMGTGKLPDDSLGGGEEAATPPAAGFAFPPALAGALGALGGLLLLGPAALWGALWRRRHIRGAEPGVRRGDPAIGVKAGSPNEYGHVTAAPESLELSSTGSWVTPSDPHPWDPAVEFHPYEDVAEWGGYEELTPPDLRFTAQGELV
ncbi:LOW QUALITY PROTEIN: nephrin [Morphnus guianensis]